MEKFYKIAGITAIIIFLGDVLYPLFIHWDYNYLANRIIDISIYVLLIWIFSILIYNSENGSRVKKASILAIIGYGICIVDIIFQYISIHLYEWINFGYVFEYSIAPLLLITGEMLLCIAILSITRLFPRKTLVFISGIIYFVCLFVSILSDVYYNFWVIGSNYYDFYSKEWSIYFVIKEYIIFWLKPISLLLFVFGLSKISKKKQ